MKYLCLAYYDERKFDSLNPSEIDRIVRECRPRDEELRESGGLLAVASLRHRTAVTLRPGSGRTVTTDGPFTESKEQVGSFFLIDATDLNDAIRIASKHPAAQIGESLGWGVEVRPIDRYEQVSDREPDR